MNTKKWLLRIPAAILGFTGLAYPVCAAVCPKGIGSCPTPGRCFLFTDADGNSVCDYTARSAASGETAAPDLQGQVSVSPAPSASAPAAPVTGTTSSAITETLSLGSMVAGIVIGIVMFLALFRLFRSENNPAGRFDTGPAVAVSILFSLGLSEIAVYLISGVARYATAFSLVYIVAGTLISVYLWKRNAMNRRAVLAVAGLSTIAGFVFASAIMPAEFSGMAGLVVGQQTLTPAIAGIGIILLLTFLAGRVFCGHLCPVGSIQEIAYSVPGKKILMQKTRIPELIRLGVFAGAIAAVICSVDMLGFSGLYDFFALTISLGFAATAVLVVASVFLYRPVCRVLCPFGVIFSVLSHFGITKLRRTNACTGCRKCEKACPVGAAGGDSSKRECYMCGRCGESCPADAIRFC